MLFKHCYGFEPRICQSHLKKQFQKHFQNNEFFVISEKYCESLGLKNIFLFYLQYDATEQ